MDGFSISKTIGQNNYEAPYMDYNYVAQVQVEQTKVEETKVEEMKVEVEGVEETKVEEEVEETKVEGVEETKVEETKVEEDCQVDFYFKDFNLQERGKIQSNTPVEKNLLSFDNIKKKWIWRDVKTEN
jgi:hypothetical protein